MRVNARHWTAPAAAPFGRADVQQQTRPPDLHLQYLRALAARECSPHTIVAYRCDLQQFASLSGCAWSDVQREHVRNYVRTLHALGRSRTTIHRKLSTLRSFYRWLAYNDLHDVNPVRGIRAPRGHRRLPHTVPTLREMKRLFEVANADVAANRRGIGRAHGFYALQRVVLLEVAYSTGARVAELAALDVRDLQLQEGHLLLKGKGKRERWGYLGDPARRSLHAFLQERRERVQRSPVPRAWRNDSASAPLFVSNHMHRFTTRGIQLAMKQLFAKAALDSAVSVHSLRHAFATHMMDAGADLAFVQELLGHASISTTRIYLHVSMEHIRRVYNAAHPRA